MVADNKEVKEPLRTDFIPNLDSVFRTQEQESQYQQSVC